MKLENIARELGALRAVRLGDGIDRTTLDRRGPSSRASMPDFAGSRTRSANARRRATSAKNSSRSLAPSIYLTTSALA